MNNFRFFLLFLATISMTLIYSNRVVFGFTVICQQNGNESDVTEIVDPDYYLLDSMNVAWMFTSTAIGMCLGPAPFYFAHAVDTRVLIFSYGVLSALSSILYPWLDSLGFWPAMASQLHFTNDLVLRWTPQSEASFFFSIMLATSQFGPLITMILGGEMCSSSFFGWEGAYYILGVGTFIASSAFAYFYSDSVEENRHLTESEKKYILTGKHSTKEKQPVPYKALLKDCTIWISLLMFTGYYLAMIVYQQYSPIFIKQWSLVFYFLVFTVVLTSILYTVFSRVSAAPWTAQKRDPNGYTIYRLSDCSPPEPVTIPMPKEIKF
uniref:MFS domain-containing protein n=1 Tax=Caenorhabditis japonica TaxID=281687 RepID=A0A8R1HS81_CAEJA